MVKNCIALNITFYILLCLLKKHTPKCSGFSRFKFAKYTQRIFLTNLILTNVLSDHKISVMYSMKLFKDSKKLVIIFTRAYIVCLYFWGSVCHFLVLIMHICILNLLLIYCMYMYDFLVIFLTVI